MSDLFNLEGKVALITGAGQGIGRQIALHYAAHDARCVIVNDFVRERADSVVEEITDLGGSAIAVQGDVTDLDGVRQIAKTAATDLGGIDVLVNNAGNAGANPSAELQRPFYETDSEVWNSFIGVNFYGVINSTAAVLPSMIEKRYGRIITIISEASRYGDPGLEVYAGAKAGAAGFTRAVARANGRHGITANCIVIAGTLTPAIEAQLAASPDLEKKVLEKYVVRRLGTPRDVANLALYLGSAESDYVTGQTYPVNGGFTFNL